MQVGTQMVPTGGTWQGLLRSINACVQEEVEHRRQEVDERLHMLHAEEESVPREDGILEC